MIKFLIEKEFKQIMRDAFMPRMIVMMPIMMILLFPWAANLDVKDIKISIVDSDQSPYSQRLIQKVLSSGYFQLTDVSHSNDEALKSVEKNNADIILEIQHGFEKNMVKEGVGNVMISANAVNSTKGGLGSTYLASIFNDYSSEIRDEWVQMSDKSAMPVITIEPQYKFNTHLDYKVFMIPAIMVILLTMLSGFLPALNIVSEKEVGTIEQMNVTPVNKFTFILAKLVPYWVIGTLVLSICFGLSALIYGLTPIGSFIALYFFAALYILVVSGLGLIISNYSNTMQQAMFVMFFFMMILILISGLFTPVASMPDWAQVLAGLNPLKYFIEVMRMVYLKGSGILDLTKQLLALSIFAVLFNGWAVFSYRKSS